MHSCCPSAKIRENKRCSPPADKSLQTSVVLAKHAGILFGSDNVTMTITGVWDVLPLNLPSGIPDVTVCCKNVWNKLFQFHKHSVRTFLKCNLHPILRRLPWNVHSLSDAHRKMSIVNTFWFCPPPLFYDKVDIISPWYFEQVIYALISVRHSPTSVVEDLLNDLYTEEVLVKQPNWRVTCVGPQGTILLKVNRSD